MIEAATHQKQTAPLPGAKDADMLTRINATAVTGALLELALRALNALPNEKRNDFDQRMSVLLDALRRDVESTQLMVSAIAIDFRLRALARLVESTLLQGCEIDLVTRCTKISAAALYVASQEPLVRNPAGLATFDPGSFKARLLN